MWLWLWLSLEGGIFRLEPRDSQDHHTHTHTYKIIVSIIMWVDVSHHLFPPTAGEVGLASSLGFTWTMLRFTVAFLLSIPTAMVFRVLPNVPTLRHIYAIVTGFCLLYYPFGAGVLHLFVSSAVVYGCMLLSPRNCGSLAWVFSMGYLILNHVNQASGLSWKEGNLDFTGAQMVATLKLISVAVCYQDGHRLAVSKSVSKLHPYAMSKRLDVRPTVLEFYSYLLSIGSLLSGPCYEFKDYIAYIHRRGDWKSIPNPLVPGTLKFIKAVFCVGLWMYVYNHLGFDVDFIEGAAWQGLPIVPRVLLLWVTVVAYRMKYYGVWTFSESMMIFSGFGYRPGGEEGGDKGFDWERYATSHILSVEFNPSIADTPRHWNICTGRWLRHYVYERLSAVGDKPSFFNMLVTQLVSGVWHGLLPGYWLFFATSAFMFQASRAIYRYERNWPSKWRNWYVWWSLKVVTSALVLNYAGSAFVVLEMGESLRVWRSVYYFGHIWTVAVLALSHIVPPKKRRD